MVIFWYKILYFFSFVMFTFFLWVSDFYIFEFSLLELNSMSVSFPLVIDKISLSFSSIMLFISGSVVYFANYYMMGEKYMNRFIVLILLFILSMNFLIFVPNLITLLLGWDGLGIVSFLLVIYYQNSKSLSAGLITILSNRIGDSLLIISIGYMTMVNNWNIFYLESMSGFMIVVLWCIVIAAMTKSAQIPFSAWLPAAMAAPTPVSALVHSSTLVTAGVYMLIRFFDQLGETLMWYILHIGVLTTLMAGMSAIFESDLKKVIALSTLSQLGVMMFSIGLGMKELCIFHLFTHALFKALLFMCAGSMIHSHHHSQDIRKVGMMWYYMPISSCSLNIANLSLCGFPFLSGFYSKDLILESMLENKITILTLILMVLGTLLTTLYSVRLTFFSLIKINNFMPLSSSLEENSNNINPIQMMTLVSIISGPSLYWMMNYEVNEPWLGTVEKFLPFALFLFGVLLMYISQQNFFLKKMKVTYMSSSMWFIAPLSSQPLVKSFFYFSENNIKLIDQGWNEIIGGQGIFKMSNFIFTNFTKIQYNKINIFVVLFFLNIIMMMLFM
uniref:NADH-ubiquinone oxidoreductase chain 5 n=1 Tax=Loxocorone allax TaxID=393181 RepID=B1B1W2_LOXAA|nr:NADH dehydrogenase subunit 5 [Loxocorone allax]BAG12577.1 NADH dehydrogenase subunit 5 [Loxocorone allax]